MTTECPVDTASSGYLLDGMQLIAHIIIVGMVEVGEVGSSIVSPSATRAE